MRLNEVRLAAIWRRSGPRWGMAVAFLLSASISTMAGMMYWRSSTLLFDTMDRSVVEQLELLSARPPDLLSFMITSRLQRAPPVVTEVGLFTADHAPIVGDVTDIPGGLEFDGKAHDVFAPVQPDIHWRAAGRQLPDGRILIVARSAEEILDVQAGLLRYASLVLIPGILLSLTAGAAIGINSERRLRQINSVAERIIDGDLAQRLPINPRGDELDRLCAIVNRILARLQTGVEALACVGENIAHDLRTPLTSVRARIERSREMSEPGAPLDQILTQSLKGIDQALSIVTALLRIAGLRQGTQASSFQPFDLAEVAKETADVFAPVAEDKGLNLTLFADDPRTIVGDRQLIVEALVNLVDNAIKFTPKGGRIDISLEGTERQPFLIVSDTGLGIPPEERLTVLHRFHRLEKSRTTPGTGLGLSLVEAIAEMHRFRLSIDDNMPGCRVTLHCWSHDTIARKSKSRDLQISPSGEM